jgi:two-component system, response regulator PdtaR
MRMNTVVLIVEDEFLLRCQLADEFREGGFVVLEAATAEEAMALCHERTPVHTLITDIQLNGSGSGWEVAKAFRAIWGNIPVVYTSGNVFEAEHSVPDGWFFVKPYDGAEVVAKCQQLIAAQNQ